MALKLIKRPDWPGAEMLRAELLRLWIDNCVSEALPAGMAHGPILNALSNPAVSLGLGSVALLGPGRPLIKDGILSLIRCHIAEPPCIMMLCMLATENHGSLGIVV